MRLVPGSASATFLILSSIMVSCDKPPLAVRIQVGGARQRLSWFARLQACERAAGWEVEAIEAKFVREVDGVELVGKVDRIDRHADGRRRVLDYKTYSKLKDVEKDHRVGVTAGWRF